MIQIAIVAILAAVAIPALLRWQFNDDRTCLRQLMRLQASVAMNELKGLEMPLCPVAEKAYRKKTKTTGEGKAAVTTVRWRCPDAERHLQVDHLLLVRGDTAVPHATYPELERFEGGPEVEEGSWSHRTELHDEGGALVVRQWAGGFGWFFSWAVLIVGVITTGAFVVLLIGRVAGAEWSDGDPPLGCVAVGGLLLLLGGHYGLGLREARFQGGAGNATITVQNRYWVFDGGVTTIRSPEALWCPPGGTFAEALHLDDEGEPAQTKLFECDPGTPALLGPLHERIYGAGTVHRPKPETGK